MQACYPKLCYKNSWQQQEHSPTSSHLLHILVPHIIHLFHLLRNVLSNLISHEEDTIYTGPYKTQDLPLWPNKSSNLLVTLLVRDKVGDALQVLALLVPCVHIYKLTRQRLCSRCQSRQQRTCNAPPAARVSTSHVEATLHAAANCGCLHKPQTEPSCEWVGSTQPSQGHAMYGMQRHLFACPCSKR
jgi:hypothetical protein